MILAIASPINSVDAYVDPHFGKCAWFCIHNTNTKVTSFLENRVCSGQNNIGVDLAKTLIDKNIDIIVAGRFGTKVVEFFRENKIQIVIPSGEKSLNEIINLIR